MFISLFCPLLECESSPIQMSVNIAVKADMQEELVQGDSVCVCMCVCGDTVVILVLKSYAEAQWGGSQL